MNNTHTPAAAPADVILRGESPAATEDAAAPLAQPEAVPTTSPPKQRNHNDQTSVIILLTCIFMPPLGAFLLKGCGAEVIIAICLTILGWIPGILYVFWLWLSEGGFQRKDVAAQRVAEAKSKWKARRAAQKMRQSSQQAPVAATQPEETPLLNNDAPSLPVLGALSSPLQSNVPYAAPDYSKAAAVSAYPLPRSSGSSMHPGGTAAGPSTAGAGFTTAPSTAEVIPTTATPVIPVDAPVEAATLVEQGVVETPIKPKVKKGKREGGGGLYMGIFSSNKNKARVAKAETPAVAAASTTAAAPSDETTVNPVVSSSGK